MSETKGSGKQVSRRRFLRVGGTLAGMAAVGSLAACGDATNTPGTAATTAATTRTASTTAAATAATGTTAAAAGSGTKPFAGRTLTIFVYAGAHEKSFREVFNPAFEAATGAKVELIPGWWDAIAKLKSSPEDQPPFDLLESDPIQSYPAIREGLFQKVDTAKLTNAKNFAPRILDSMIYKESWGLPFISSPMTLFWHKELVPEGLTRWSDLFSEGLKGKITMYNSYYISLYTFAIAKVEMDGKPGTAKAEMENNLDGVLQFAKEKRDWVKYWWPTTTDGVNALLQKNVSAGNIHGNGVITPLRDNKPVGYIIPENDRAYVELFLVVSKTSKNKDLAEAAMNFFASEQIQREMGLKVGELSVNTPAVAQEVATKWPIWGKVYPVQPDDFNRINFYPYLTYDKNSDKISKFWDREILRKA